MQEIQPCDPFPEVVRIESVGKCNFKCIHCPTGTEPNERVPLTREQFHLILDQWKERAYVPRVAVLYHGGEPLLNRDLGYFIITLKKLGVKKTVMTTNAFLLNEKRAEELISAGLDELKVSFDGESPEENNAIRKNADFFRNAQNVIVLRQLKEKLGRSNPRIIISNVRIADEPTLRSFDTPSKSYLQFLKPPQYLLDFFNAYKEEFEFRSFPAMVWSGFEKFGDFRKFEFLPENPTYCGNLFETFSILTTGDVVLCCNDLKGDLVMGNIYKTNMFDVWKSRGFQNLRRNFTRKLYPKFCQGCNTVCGRYLVRDVTVKVD